MEIVILSHRRAGRVSTTKHVDGCLICIPESQLAEYLEHHDREQLVTHPDAVVGSSAKRDWIYRKFGDVFQLDDDCIGMFRLTRGLGAPYRVMAPPSEARDAIMAAAETARELGAYLFGFASHAHPRSYKGNRPFRFGGYSPSGALGLLAGSKLWFPTTRLMVEDYWIVLLNAHFHRFAYYDGRWAFGFGETYRGIGGNAEFRFSGVEQASTEWLKEQFGSDVVVPKLKSTMLSPRAWNPGGRSIRMPWKC